MGDRKLSLIKKFQLDKNKLLNFYRTIFLSRRVDDTEINMKKQSNAFFQISGAGHEGILTAVASLLRPKYDYFIGYYRDRALCLQLGMTPYEMFCQANGNEGDIASHGRQMPAHWGHVGLNIVTKSSCTGTQFNQACGLSEAGIYFSNLEKNHQVDDLPVFHDDEIVYVSSGDGTIAQGEFWEGLNTAIVGNLPILFLIEDNGYAISVTSDVQVSTGSISQALKNFPGIKIYEVDGNCPVESYAVASEAINYLRKRKGGPVLIHAHVTRPYSHSMSDDHAHYRKKEDLEKEKKADVFYSYPEFLIKNKLCTEAEIQQVQDEVNQLIKNDHDSCLKTPWPKKETYKDHLYSHAVDMTSDDFSTPGLFQGKNDIPMAQTINTVLKNEVARNPLIRVFGEDVADFSDIVDLKDPNLKGKGGVFKITSGVQRAGVPHQVFNSPLAEANIIGRAIGMAIRGLKPVVEIQFFDYIWPSFMQIKNELATTRYRSGGDYTCPVVVRTAIGGYLKGGAIYHSQCGESLFTHIPGLFVAYPSNAADAAGLLRTAIRGDDPVLFLEHKHLYYQGYNRTADPGPDYMIPFGKARLVQSGSHATVVCWGALVQKCIEAAKVLNEEGFSIEILDLRTLAPIDLQAIVQSVKKTHRLLVAHEETKTSGFAGEIFARINEECFESLDAPLMRIASEDVHVAYCPDLEDVILPQTKDVVDVLRKLVRY